MLRLDPGALSPQFAGSLAGSDYFADPAGNVWSGSVAVLAYLGAAYDPEHIPALSPFMLLALVTALAVAAIWSAHA